MSKLPLVISLLALSLPALGTTYYVSTKGNDANPGSRSRPFLTVQKAADVMLPGDTCYVRGGVYRETVRPANSGQPGKPVRFAAFGRDKVVITGADPITGWEHHKGRIYKAAAPWALDQLFIDGRMMNEARWPNTGADPMHPTLAVAVKGSTPTSIVDPKLDQPSGAWDGAIAHITPGARWVSWTRKIKGYSPDKHEFTFDKIADGWAYEVKEGTQYYITRTMAALDAPGEWFYDAASQTVYLIPPEGCDLAKAWVEAKRRQLAFDLSKRSYVEISGFRVFASSAVLADADHCAIENCHFRYISHFVECGGWGTGMDDSGIIVSGHDNEIRRCSIEWSAGNGIALLGERNKVTNCLIRNVDYCAVDCGAIRAMGKGHVISHNTLYNAGRSVLVHRYLKAGRIEYNHMYNPGLLTTDLGCTYCFDTDGEGTVICYNWVHDNHTHCGVGIYVDNGSPNHIVHHNVSWNNDNSGIRLNTPCLKTACYNNTLFANGDSFHHWGTDEDQTGTRIVNNAGEQKAEFTKGAIVENNLFGNDLGLVDAAKLDFRPRKDSPCIDAGVAIEGFTEGFKGKTPDLGAYEFGGERWVAGHDWGEAPEVNY